MTLSKETLSVLIDLVENKLSMMQVGDRDDLRDMIALQRCLAELQGKDPADTDLYKTFGDIPTRGRRRKISGVFGGR